MRRGRDKRGPSATSLGELIFAFYIVARWEKVLGTSPSCMIREKDQTRWSQKSFASRHFNASHIEENICDTFTIFAGNLHVRSYQRRSRNFKSIVFEKCTIGIILTGVIARFSA